MARKKRSWEYRLAGGPDELTIGFVESLSVDRRLYKYDVAGSIAHAQMLANEGLITQSEFKKIRGGLVEIGKRIALGKFSFDKAYEDIHMAIESALIKKIGDVGRKLHAARSRNDQVATDVRLWLRDQVEVLQAKLTGLQKAFVKLAAKHASDIMPGYTHLQRAQPVTVACYLLSFVEQLQRDWLRLENCRRLFNVCPLGSGALAGSTLGIDRRVTAKQLGFADISRNSIDAVADRDFCAEFIFDCALIATHLSKLAEDWIIYSSGEFDFVRIDDSFCTSSSMMPHKRNPDVLELVRARSARVYGALVALLTVLKAQPSGYNRDLQEDKIYIFSASDTIIASLDVVTAIVLSARFNTTRIKAMLQEGFMDSTALAEYLVKKGVPFRKAHGVVGLLIAYCEKAGRKLASLDLKVFKRFSPVITGDVYKILGATNAASSYVSVGSAGPAQAKLQIKYWNKHLARR